VALTLIETLRLPPDVGGHVIARSAEEP